MVLLVGCVKTGSSSNAPSAAAACPEADQESSAFLRSEVATM